MGKPKGSHQTIDKQLTVSELENLASNVKYKINPKHKPPKGAGTQCPKDIKPKDCQEMLENALKEGNITKPKFGQYPKGVWYYDAKRALFFHAKSARTPENEYHGFPIPKEQVPNEILKKYEQ